MLNDTGMLLREAKTSYSKDKTIYCGNTRHAPRWHAIARLPSRPSLFSLSPLKERTRPPLEVSSKGWRGRWSAAGIWERCCDSNTYYTFNIYLNSDFSPTWQYKITNQSWRCPGGRDSKISSIRIYTFAYNMGHKSDHFSGYRAFPKIRIWHNGPKHVSVKLIHPKGPQTY